VLKTLIFLVALPFTAFGQAPPTGHGALVADLQALSKADSDGARDSLSARIRSGLSALLSAADALTADLSDVPMSRVDAADGKFRLLTWNVPHDNGTFAYEGFLLVKARHGATLIPLHDATAAITDAGNAQLSPEKWYGALYYAVVPVRKGGKTYYTLLGWKGISGTETRKVIEVLSFSGSTPRFGANIFNDGNRVRRHIFAYTAQASMQLRWDEARKAIVLDHLSAINPEFAGTPAFMAPDLSFDSYTWNKGHWNYQRDIDLRQGGRSRPYNAPPKEQR
jgi:hypothetical protein